MENILPDAGKLLEISLQYEERAIGVSPLLHNFSRCTELFGVSVSETMGARGHVNGGYRSAIRCTGRYERAHACQGALVCCGGIATQGA